MLELELELGRLLLEHCLCSTRGPRISSFDQQLLTLDGFRETPRRWVSLDNAALSIAGPAEARTWTRLKAQAAKESTKVGWTRPVCVCSYAVRCGTRLSSNARLHLVRGKRAVLCCAVMSLEINNNEVGRWLAQVLFEAGPSQNVIGLTATCIPSLNSANRLHPLPSEAPASQKLQVVQRLCLPCACALSVQSAMTLVSCWPAGL